MEVKRNLINIFTILSIVIIPHLGFFPNFSYSIPLLLLVWLVLKSQKEKFSDIWFRWKSFSWNALFSGILAGIVIFIFLQISFFPILESFITFEEVDIGINNFLKKSLGSYIFILIMAWIIGGFYEELIFHGFIFTRLEKMIPSKHAIILSFVITNIIFAFYHAQMGPIGVINAFLAGLAYNGIALYFKRNLWYSIIAHGTYNTIVITAIYFDFL